MNKKLILAATLLFASTAIAGEKSDLRILYVGESPERVELSGSELYEPDEDIRAQRLALKRSRTPIFESFLAEHFATVDVAYADEYEEANSDNYDVTIFGDTPKRIKEAIYEYDEDGNITNYEHPEFLTAEFDKASILINTASPMISEPLEYKMDWLCLCLDANAHGMKTEHTIFNSPNKVELTITEEKTPENYFAYYNGQDLSETMPMWRAQDEGYGQNKAVSPGMVSSGPGFAEAPDAEVISYGVNTKSYNSVALGRHGNFFHWGFSAAPDTMTDEAQLVFLNSIHYIAAFDGEKPYSRRQYRVSSRDYALDGAWFMRSSTYEGYVEMQHANLKGQQDFIKMSLEQSGEGPSFAQKRLLAQEEPEIVPEDEWLQQNVLGRQPKELVGLLGTDINSYVPYYEENFEYLMSAGETYKYIADEDAKALGLSNRNPEILNAAITQLEIDGDNAAAQTLLERYTSESFDNAADWREWYDANDGHFYFTEVNGHKFEIAPVPTGP